MTIMTQTSKLQGTGSNSRGRECINVHFLKPLSLRVDESGLICSGPVAGHLQTQIARYKYRRDILQHLPTKLAQYLAENYFDELRLRPKSGAQWSVADLDRILYENVVEVGGGHLRTFTTLEFEHENYQGRYTARCFAFEKHYGQTVQVVYYRCLFMS
jgi:hypothetical protein